MTKSEIKIDDFFKEEELPMFMAWIIRAKGDSAEVKVTSNGHVNQIHARLDSPTRGPGRTLTFRSNEWKKVKQNRVT